MIASFFIWVAVIIALLVYELPHDPWINNKDRTCGPIPNMINSEKLVIDLLNQYKITSIFVFALSYYPIFILLFILLTGYGIWTRAIHEMNQRYIND